MSISFLNNPAKLLIFIRIWQVAPVVNSTEPVCGDCYGAKLNETHCCNTCQDVIDAYREKRWNPEPEKFEQCKRENYIDKTGDAKKLALNEGCQIYGYIEVNRVNFFRFLSNGSVWSFFAGKLDEENWLRRIVWKNFCNENCLMKIAFVPYSDGRQFPRGTRQKFFTKSHTHPRCAPILIVIIQSITYRATFIIWWTNQFCEYASAWRNGSVIKWK